jgi:NAD(P)-dependent dehydrogenase (short-subunit alcohol dehydrogenase family)
VGGADDATIEAIGGTFPLGRIARPEEVAAAALFLMANQYVTGTVVTVDGGASHA